MNKVCSTCGGSGQVGFFQGASRFLLTWEECPQCNGTGGIDHDSSDSNKHSKQGTGKKNRPEKKKKT